MKAVLAGLGFGLLPDLQMQPYISRGELVDLAPGFYLDTPLYWHHWQCESPLLRQLRLQVQVHAAASLQPII